MKNNGELISEEELNQIKNMFYYVDYDCNNNKRLYFDNAGGSFRLKKAEDEFKRIDDIPDCSERHHEMAKYLQSIENKGRCDMRVIFNAKEGTFATGYTASQMMFEMVRVFSENTKGTNMVTTVLEHPSAFDSMKMYAEKHNCKLRVAKSNPETGGVDADEVIKLVDKNTRLLSVMAASNISGYILDIEKIVKKSREINPDLYIIIDAVQHAPHGLLDIDKLKIDGMNIAPYKFFGVRGFGVAYLSNRASKLIHHKLAGKDAADWELGSPAPAHYAAITEIVNYVCQLGEKVNKGEKNRRKLFEIGMERITNHERALIYTLLEGTSNSTGLRYIPKVHVYFDDEDLTHRDLIMGIGFDNISCTDAVKEYEKRNVIVYERIKENLYSQRMIESFGLEGLIRVSPLHCNSIKDIEYFLKITKDISLL